MRCGRGGGNRNFASRRELRLLDHVVRPQQKRRRDPEAERPGGLEVDDEFERGGLLDGQVGRPCPLEDLVRQTGGATIHLGVVHSVGDQAPGKLGGCVDLRHRGAQPVMFAPGWARLATRPCPTGSPTPMITTGIAPVAFLAASAAGVPRVRIRSTFSRASSLARPGNRWSWPSADRYSRTKCSPSTYPRSRSPCRKAWTLAALIPIGVLSILPLR